MLSRRITSSVLERCRELMGASSGSDLASARRSVSPELHSELKQIKDKMTLMLRQAEKLEGAQEKALLLEEEEIRELIGRIEVIATETSKQVERKFDSREFPNASWLAPKMRAEAAREKNSTKITNRSKLNSDVRRTSISSPYKVSKEREKKNLARKRNLTGIVNPSACKIAERLLREGAAFEKVASKLNLSLDSVKSLAKLIEDDFRRELRRSSRTNSKRMAVKTKPVKKETKFSTTVAQGKGVYPEAAIPTKIETQLEETLKHQALALEAVASITLGRKPKEAKEAQKEPVSKATKKGSPFRRQQLLL